MDEGVMQRDADNEGERKNGGGERMEEGKNKEQKGIEEIGEAI